MVTAASRAMNSSFARNALGSVKMTACAAKLATAIASPHASEARGACFPLYPAPDSHKVTAFSRFDAAIGASGFGFVAVNPSIASNMPSAYFSVSAFAGDRVSVLSATDTYTAGVGSTGHNGPYFAEQVIRTNGEAEPSLAGRVVAVGVRITYTGTKLNESGMCTLLQHPTHGNLAGVSVAGLQGFSESDICPFTRKPCDLVIAPVAVSEAGYPGPTESTNLRLMYPMGPDGKFHTVWNDGGQPSYTKTQQVDGVAVPIGAPVACIMVNGVPGSTFHVDIIYHLEYAGRTAASACTPNSVDVSSVYAILTAASQLSTRKMAYPNESNWKLLMDGVRAALGSPVAVSATGVVRGVIGL